MHPGSARSHEESADPRAVLSGARGSEGHSGPARSLDERGTTRPRALLLPLQYRRAHPGGARCLPAGDPVRIANLRASLRQGTKGTAEPSLARNRVVAMVALSIVRGFRGVPVCQALCFQICLSVVV